MDGWWLLISHLGAAMLGATIGVIVTAILAAGASAERIEESWRLAAGSRQQDEHELGPGR